MASNILVHSQHITFQNIHYIHNHDLQSFNQDSSLKFIQDIES